MRLHKQNKQLADRVERLEHKVVSMRQLGEAQAILMRMHSINESQAYEILRTQAMAKRLPIETICQSIIQANDVFSMTAPKKVLIDPRE